MSYPGGKGASGVVQTIINQQPPHDVYIEAFLGGGAVARAKRPASVNIGIDLSRSSLASFAAAGSCGFDLLRCSAMDFLLEWSLKNIWTGRELVYCDPPYLMCVRRNRAKMYRHEMDDIAHSRLLQTIAILPCMVQISGYDSVMYRTHLKGWRLVQFQAATRHGVRTECLWMNYSEPEVLHDFRFLGKDFRERERIKRKAERWTLRLLSLPRLERLAIYANLASGIDGFGDATGLRSPDRAATGDIVGCDGVGCAQNPIAISGGVSRHLSPDSTMIDRAPLKLEVLQ